MTEAALYQFFSGFGIPAYRTDCVPDGAALPYLTYEQKSGSFLQGEMSLTVTLWYYDPSDAAPAAKAAELAEALGDGGKLLPCGPGYLWLRQGSPWCQCLTAAADRNLRRRVLNVTMEPLIP